MRLITIFFLMSVFLVSCSKTIEPIDEPILEPEPEEIIDSSYVGFNMYFLEEEGLTGSDISNATINEHELQKPPFVTQGNIQYYDTSAHVIYLKESLIFSDPAHILGKPFIVSTNSMRHYVGVLWPMISSASYCGPVINVGPRFYPNDMIKISTGSIPMQNDFRLNKTIIQTLNDYDVFHAGISLSIDSVAILKNDSVNNDCSISFSLKIINNDEQNLYVFDPVKMGDVFYWYNSSPLFLKTDNTYYNSSIGGKEPEDGADKLSWLTKIESKDSVSWTLEKQGYPFIQPGDYQFFFSYWGLNSSSKSFREQPDGRIWMGKITTRHSITVY